MAVAANCQIASNCPSDGGGRGGTLHDPLSLRLSPPFKPPFDEGGGPALGKGVKSAEKSCWVPGQPGHCSARDRFFARSTCILLFLLQMNRAFELNWPHSEGKNMVPSPIDKVEVNGVELTVESSLQLHSQHAD